MTKRKETAKKKPVVAEVDSELLPLIPLKDIVVFPGCITPLFVMRPKSLNSLEDAVASDKRLFLVTQKSVEVETPAAADLYEHGTVAEVLQVLKMPDGAAKVLVEGQFVARVLGFEQNDRLSRTLIVPFETLKSDDPSLEAKIRLVLNQFETYVRLYDKIPDELYASIRNYEDPIQIANAVSHYANFKTRDKQQLLETQHLDKKLVLLSQLLAMENELLELENQIMTQVRTQIGKSQKEYFLNEQLKVIEKELGLSGEEDIEIEELADKIDASKLPEEAREKATRELNRLAKMAPMSPEATVSRTYIEWLLDLPWGKGTKDKRNLKAAQEVLDRDHYGLEKVKDRITEYLAVHQLTKHPKGSILCLVGPPGVGKTSLANSVADALGRKFVRISLGGVRDEAEIRGHRRTYIGSLPGKILQAMKKAGTSNPVILLDEIDKMSADFRGDPASALLEVLDPEQNKAFNDHYLEVDYNLSDVFFITTANTSSGIPHPLLDRMELIRLPGYTEEEKIMIGERYLVPKQIEANGLADRNIEFSRRAVQVLVVNHTREAGVRNLEREIATVCRRIAKELVASGAKASKSAKQKITPERIRAILGPKKYKDSEGPKDPEIGVATGLAWTEVGGEILPAEVTVMKGKGTLVLTGQLGEVMQESAKAALSYIRSRSVELKLPEDFYQNLDIHVHIPEGAIPKDGPSAGVTLTTSMVSALTKRPVRQDIAMTGEINLRGKVLKIGGLKEKVLAAHRAHIMDVIIPNDNIDDLEDISRKVRKEMKFYPVENVDQVLDMALTLKAVKKPEPRKAASRTPAKTTARTPRRP